MWTATILSIAYNPQPSLVVSFTNGELTTERRFPINANSSIDSFSIQIQSIIDILNKTEELQNSIVTGPFNPKVTEKTERQIFFEKYNQAQNLTKLVEQGLAKQAELDTLNAEVKLLYKPEYFGLSTSEVVIDKL